ncbi:transcription termination/antitermination protein NusG [Flavisolibacter ginsengisoli]|jgi:transcription antitermination factor NusG|uniref:Transcription antitermination factor NusG n=1 Tax=Flavisolibacter ginsengisoli DSM 18119 TaxID=1121884 RepID=A0A1M5BAP5_9BACT|nr:UpxY family transcription antiterminator [Flavisolibacter ginsengisoli]SHF39397.1 Transcription antitermination factor NusG [Flavisolibacter ginsengisoli DSM 18119]
MILSKKWYAIYTRPRWEKKIAGALVQKDVVTYCPLNRVSHQWSDRKKIVHEPLFKSYVFVQIAIEEMIKVKETDGVIKFVYWLNKPAVIRDEEIEAIKKFLSEHMNVQLERTDIGINDVVRIASGPFMQYQGSISEVRKNKVKVILPSLGYMMTVEVEKSNLEVVKKSNNSHIRYSKITDANKTHS